MQDSSALDPNDPDDELTRREVLQRLGLSAAALMLTSAVPRAFARGAVASDATRSVAPFDLSSTRLLSGPFRNAQQLDATYLRTLEPDRLLHNFRVNAGLQPKAPVYGGWESREPWVEIRCHGHTLGHYLSACAMMFASTGDEALQQRVAYMVAELHACQQARKDGLVCAFPDGATQLENSLSDRPFLGVPWYTMHKVFAGLRDAHVYARNRQALDVLVSLADWTDAASRGLSDERFQTMLEREHGGMNEVLADVFALTGNKRHLALAERFTHRAILAPLTEGRDTLDGLHSNTQIPKVIGFARLHEITGKPAYRDASAYFWRTVVQERSFATGGNGDVEHFFPSARFADHMSSAKTMETCCTHNMLRLTRALFTHAPSVAYVDYYERALFNGILASQDPQTGMMTYFQATRPGYVKLYHTPADSFWCCTGSGMENHAKYGDSIYFHDAAALYVNLFIASELNWSDRGLRVTQTTNFPESDATRIAIRASRPARLTVKIRHPSWCRQVSVMLNGSPLTRGEKPGTYIDIERTWRDGDVLHVVLPMQLHLEPLPGVPDVAALMYGPIVLAGRFGTEGLTPGADIIVNERTSGEMLDRPMEIPQLALTSRTLDDHVTRDPDSPLAFRTRLAAPARDVELVPYHRIAHERYNLYWRLASSAAPIVSSPNGRITVRFDIDADGIPRYSMQLDGKPCLQPSRLGLVREDADFSTGLTLAGMSEPARVSDDYTLLTSKRKLNRYVANQRVVELRAANGEPLHIIFQVSDDGVAFRYLFPRESATVHRLKEERSSFRFLPGTVAWLQPMSVAKSGWQGVNPAYEELYEKEIAVGTPPSTGAGWAYPALFRSEDVWMLISEGSLPRNYCGTRLRSAWHETEYTVSFPDALEGIRGGPVNPESALPWQTPWRFVVVGTLKTLVESTLGTDLAEKPAPDAKAQTDAPGKASWSWPLLGDDQTTFPVQKRFIDYAADMNWRYTLIDGLWDQQIGYDKLKELVTYADGKGVKILVWYNSAGNWNTTPQSPRDRMLDHGTRMLEFERLKAIGVAGLKIDFFGGDGQSVIGYYRDILEDAAPYGFLMNFHGATLPRGWHRTFPNLMTAEAVRGMEFVTFEQRNADEEPSHVAMLPFTRNVFDPMDFTPMVLDRIQRIERRTSSAFELALTVLFTSGIQHYAEIPEGMAKAPDYVREFLRRVPSVWDQVKFVDGFPGKHVVIARQGDGRWYVAGVNAETTAVKLKLSFADVAVSGVGKMITEGRDDGRRGALSFRQESVQLSSARTLDVTVKPRGGFVIVFG